MRYMDKCERTENHDRTVTFTGPCRMTGKPYSVTVKSKELLALGEGAHIQDAMPSLSAEDREFLISGYSPEGWDKIFGRLKDE